MSYFFLQPLHSRKDSERIKISIVWDFSCFAFKAGYQVIATNELLGLGAANVAGAFCGGVPTQVGLSRMGALANAVESG